MQTLLTTSSTSSLSSSLICWTVLRLLVLTRLCFQACPLVSGPAPHLHLHHQLPLGQVQQPPPWSPCPACSRSARSPYSRQHSLAIRQIRPCHFPSYMFPVAFRGAHGAWEAVPGLALACFPCLTLPLSLIALASLCSLDRPSPFPVQSTLISCSLCLLGRVFLRTWQVHSCTLFKTLLQYPPRQPRPNAACTRTHLSLVPYPLLLLCLLVHKESSFVLFTSNVAPCPCGYATNTLK